MPKMTLNQLIQGEVARISQVHDTDIEILQEFANFVIENYKKKDPKPQKIVKPKPLTLPKLKESIYKYFEVKTTAELKKSGSFQMATSGMGKIDLSKKDGWESLYRKFVGVLPNDENEEGYGCINGINIFKYEMPWRTFGLDPKASTTEDVKSAYRKLSKIYHPDSADTGDAQIFERLTIFYKSLTEKF